MPEESNIQPPPAQPPSALPAADPAPPAAPVNGEPLAEDTDDGDRAVVAGLAAKVLALEAETARLRREAAAATDRQAAQAKERDRDREMAQATAQAVNQTLRDFAARMESLDAEAEPELFTRVFWAEITGFDADANGGDGAYTWKEKISDGSATLQDYVDGRFCDDATDESAAVEINGSITVAAGKRVLMIETEESATHRYHFVVASGDSIQMVLVNPNGFGGDGNPTYDVFDQADGLLVTPLNLAGPLAPTCSRVRLNSAISVTAAAIGATGLAYNDTDGAIQLFDLPEEVCVSEDLTDFLALAGLIGGI